MCAIVHEAEERRCYIRSDECSALCATLSAMSDRVGVRELRQDLSRYLRRVQAGERLIVTERGRPVAELAPWADTTDPIDRLIAAGRARRGGGRLLSVKPVDRPVSTAGTDALEMEREERL
jgi:prevent-host-death family protein